VIGTERHESRRIDNQLRGRSGRQGDPGSTRFYLSLEDSLLRIFASERVSSLMQRLGMQEGEAIESGMVSRVIENAQRKVEGHNFDIRKHLLEFDDVANDQRKVVYQQRDELLEAEDISETIDAMREDVVSAVISEHIPPNSIDEQWDIEGLEEALQAEFNIRLPVQQWLDEEEALHEESLRERILEKITEQYREKESQVGAEVMRQVEKSFLLQILDAQWKDHLAAMDFLRQGIGLRGMAQRDPKQEFKREAFAMFQEMLEGIKRETIKILCHVRVRTEEDARAVEEASEPREQDMQFQHAQSNSFADSAGGGEQPEPADESQQPFVRQQRKVGRNEPCPCGSGKKFKHCHGKLAG
jgi:preprotein translocase subunit SecA